DSGYAVLPCVAVSLIAGLIIARQPDDSQFLLRVFIFALLIRLILGTAIFVFRGQDFFGGDALTYDFLGVAQIKAWGGDRYYAHIINLHLGHNGGTSWGMVYLVAGLYTLIGRNVLAVQFINAVLGAATAAI